MKPGRWAWSLSLLAQLGCASHRYAVSDERAASRHHRQWLVSREPPPQPEPVRAEAPAAAEPSSVEEGAEAQGGAAASQAAFPEEGAASAEAGNIPEAGGALDSVPSEAPLSEPAPGALGGASPPPSTPMAHARVSLVEESEAWEHEPKNPKLQRMVWALSLRFGGTFASEDLFTAYYTDGSSETLSTGGGVNIFLGTVVTPFKFGSHSLSFGFEGGWKFSSIGQGSDTDVSFSRKAFMPRVQYGYALNPALHWVTALGSQYETDVTLKARGALVGSAEFENAWGFFGETGFLLDVGYFGLDLTVRHTRLDYSLPEGPSISGNSVGFFCGFQIGLLRADNEQARR